MNNNVLVSIICTTYNHENFIRYTLEGFLKQEVNFRYEILIHDDASTDNTQNILREYERRYPHLIKVVYQKENQYSQGKPILENLLNKAKGKYLAFCEGDDFWNDELKLQKQVSFLQRNNDFSASYHNVYIIDGENNIYNDNKARNSFPLYRDFILEKGNILLGNNIGQLGTLVCINFWKNFMEYRKDMYIRCKANGDIKLVLILNYIGNIRFFSDVMSSYRRTYNTDSYNSRIKNLDLSIKYYDNIFALKDLIENIFCVKISNTILKRSFSTRLLVSIVNLFQKKDKQSFFSFIRIYTYSNVKVYFIWFFIYRCFKHILRKINNTDRIAQDECIIVK